MERPRLSFAEITDITDPLFPQWLDLYETAFPPSEKLLVSTILGLLREASSATHAPPHFIAVQDASGEFTGMMLYQVHQENALATLWFLAIQPSKRGQGFGAAAYQELIRRLDPTSYEALLFEVEIPRGKAAEEGRRRIAFYRRQGAFLLEGIHYLQHVGWHLPPTPMHLMVHPLRPLDAASAFALAQRAFGEAVEMRGRLRLS